MRGKRSGFPRLRVTIDVPAKIFAISLQELHGLWHGFFFKYGITNLIFFTRKFKYVSCLFNHPLSLREYFQNAACFCLCTSAPFLSWQQKEIFLWLGVIGKLLLEPMLRWIAWTGKYWIQHQSLRTQIQQFQFNLHYLWAIVSRTTQWFTRLDGWYSQSIRQATYFAAFHFACGSIFLQAPNIFRLRRNVTSISMGAKILVQLRGLVVQDSVVMVKKLLHLVINWLHLQQKLKKGRPEQHQVLYLPQTQTCACHEKTHLKFTKNCVGYKCSFWNFHLSKKKHVIFFIFRKVHILIGEAKCAPSLEKKQYI